MFNFKLWAATAALVTMASAAQAVLMVYSYQVNASGQLNGTSFTNTAVSVTLTGESAAAYPHSDFAILVPANTTLIEVAGVGSDSFLHPIIAVSNFVDGYLGIGEPISD